MKENIMKENISRVIIIILGFCLLFVKGYLYKKEIEENKNVGICKFVLCKDFPKTTESFFKYNVNNNWYRNSYGQCPDSSEDKINKFFVMYYSSKDLNKIQVDFLREVTDTIAILKAGFSREEIELIK